MRKPGEMDEATGGREEAIVGGRLVGEATEAIGQYSADKANEAIEGAESTLDALRQKSADLREDAGKLQDTAQTEFQSSVDQLNQKLEDAEQRLTDLREAGAEAWAEAQDDLDSALKDLETAYEEAVAAVQQAGMSDDSPADDDDAGNAS